MQALQLTAWPLRPWVVMQMIEPGSAASRTMESATTPARTTRVDSSRSRSRSRPRSAADTGEVVLRLRLIVPRGAHDAELGAGLVGECAGGRERGFGEG